MTVLRDYDQFAGRHWETGSIVNALAYRGVRAPHTGRHFSEALLMGVSGGVVMGYFNFSYEGYDPQARILTRNTFDPWDTMLSRLGIIQNVRHTGSPERGERNLVEALEEGNAAIVWADIYTLPYNALTSDDGMWAMFPHVVFKYDRTGNLARLADRAAVPNEVLTEILHRARAKVKKYKYRVVTLDPPIADKLAPAVQLGIYDTIKLYTEKPPKGAANNFGLKAYEWWAKQLTNPRARMSWDKQFPAGRAMLAGLASAYDDIMHFGKNNNPADRRLYADFLEEAAIILGRPALAEVALRFREAADAWQELSLALLPDSVGPFAKFRALIDRSYQLFHDNGSEATKERVLSATQRKNILERMDSEFPLETPAVVSLRENLATHVMAIHEIESVAVSELREAMT